MHRLYQIKPDQPIWQLDQTPPVAEWDTEDIEPGKPAPGRSTTMIVCSNAPYGGTEHDWSYMLSGESFCVNCGLRR